jgi:hypothetical protein
MIVRDFSNNMGSVAAVSAELYGIELEVENGRVPDDVDRRGWRWIEDGSLRNSGIEFLTNPTKYEDLSPLFATFYEWYNSLDFRSNVRTSTHVHVNVLDYTLEQVGAALTAYAVLEPLLFKVCGHEREENIYCVPWYRAPEQATRAGDLVGGEWMSVAESCKYSSLYLEPLIRFGTLEFRQAPLWATQDELEYWVRLIRAVVHGAVSTYGNSDLVLETVRERGVNHLVEDLLGAADASRLRIICQPDEIEQIIDDADSITVAECISPLLCTYKVTDDAWAAPAFNVEGDGAAGYRNVAFSRHGGGHPMYAPDEYPEDMDEHEEYYDDEGDY